MMRGWLLIAFAQAPVKDRLSRALFF